VFLKLLQDTAALFHKSVCCQGASCVPFH
jgi:hypothetical protein